MVSNTDSITIREGRVYQSCDAVGATEPCEPGVDALERAPGADASTDISDRVRGPSCSL